MLVPGYEHHMWQCSGCSTVEQRMTFNPEKPPNQTAPAEPAQTMLVEPTEVAPAQWTETVPVEPTQTVSVEPSQAVPVEPTQTVSVEPSQAIPVEPTQTVSVEPSEAIPVEPTKTTPVEPIQTVSSEPIHPEPHAAMPKMSARAKALDEKLRNLKERAKAATETARPTQFHRDLDNKPRPVPQPSASSDAPGHVKPDELLLQSLSPLQHQYHTTRQSRMRATRRL
jgi:hypothetical protein